MWSSFSRPLLGIALATALTACGGDLTLPENGSPPPDDRSPAALVVVSGNGQEERVGEKLEEPLVVRLIDASTRPVVGVPVAFAFQSSAPDAEVDPTTATTDTDGRASAEVRLGSTVGDHTVEARVAGPSSLLATFGVTALARGGRGGDGGHGGGGGGGGDNDDDDDD